VCAAKRPGGLFFRGFHLAEQKKATQGAGAEQPASKTAPLAIRPFCGQYHDLDDQGARR